MTAALMQFIMALVAVAAVARVEGTLEANAVSRDLEVNLVVPFDFAHHMMCWRSCFPDYIWFGREGGGGRSGGKVRGRWGGGLFARIRCIFVWGKNWNLLLDIPTPRHSLVSPPPTK